MRVQFNSGMSCQINQYNNDISAKQGKYVDLKKTPERSAELPESRDWPALGEFLAGVNRCEALRTTGCTSKGKTEGGHESPFVDIAFDDSGLGGSETARRELQAVLTELEETHAADGLVLELCDAEVVLPDGSSWLSTRIWFLGSRQQAEQAFPSIVELLSQQRAAHYLILAEDEIAENKIRAANDRRNRFKFKLFLWSVGIVFAYMVICTLWATFSFVKWLSGY